MVFCFRPSLLAIVQLIMLDVVLTYQRYGDPPVDSHRAIRRSIPKMENPLKGKLAPESPSEIVAGAQSFSHPRVNSLTDDINLLASSDETSNHLSYGTGAVSLLSEDGRHTLSSDDIRHDVTIRNILSPDNSHRLMSLGNEKHLSATEHLKYTRSGTSNGWLIEHLVSNDHAKLKDTLSSDIFDSVSSLSSEKNEIRPPMWKSLRSCVTSDAIKSKHDAHIPSSAVGTQYYVFLKDAMKIGALLADGTAHISPSKRVVKFDERRVRNHRNYVNNAEHKYEQVQNRVALSKFNEMATSVESHDMKNDERLEKTKSIKMSGGIPSKTSEVKQNVVFARQQHQPRWQQQQPKWRQLRSLSVLQKISRDNTINAMSKSYAHIGDSVKDMEGLWKQKQVRMPHERFKLAQSSSKTLLGMNTRSTACTNNAEQAELINKDVPSKDSYVYPVNLLSDKLHIALIPASWVKGNPSRSSPILKLLTDHEFETPNTKSQNGIFKRPLKSLGDGEVEIANDFHILTKRGYDDKEDWWRRTHSDDSDGYEQNIDSDIDSEEEGEEEEEEDKEEEEEGEAEEEEEENYESEEEERHEREKEVDPGNVNVPNFTNTQQAQVNGSTPEKVTSDFGSISSVNPSASVPKNISVWTTYPSSASSNTVQLGLTTSKPQIVQHGAAAAESSWWQPEPSPGFPIQTPSSEVSETTIRSINLSTNVSYLSENIVVTVNATDFSRLLLATDKDWTVQYWQNDSLTDAARAIDYLILHFDSVLPNIYVTLAPQLSQVRHLFGCHMTTSKDPRDFIYGGWHRVGSDYYGEPVTCISRTVNVTTIEIAAAAFNMKMEDYKFKEDDNNSQRQSNIFSFYLDPASLDGPSSSYICIATDKEQDVYSSPILQIGHINAVNSSDKMIMPRQIISKYELQHNCLGLKSESDLSFEWFKVDLVLYDYTSVSVSELIHKHTWQKINNFSSWQNTASQDFELILCNVSVKNNHHMTSVGPCNVQQISQFFLKVKPQAAPNFTPPNIRHISFPAVKNEHLTLTCTAQSYHPVVMRYGIFNGTCLAMLDSRPSTNESWITASTNISASTVMCFMCEYTYMKIALEINVEPEFSVNIRPNHEEELSTPQCPAVSELGSKWNAVKNSDDCILSSASIVSNDIHDIRCVQPLCQLWPTVSSEHQDNSMQLLSETENLQVSAFYTERQFQVCHRTATPDTIISDLPLILVGLGIPGIAFAAIILILWKKTTFRHSVLNRFKHRTTMDSMFKSINSSQISMTREDTCDEYGVSLPVGIHPHEMVPRSKVALKMLIGSGRFGRVYRAQITGFLDAKDRKNIVAVKVTKKERRKYKSTVKKLSKEAEILRRIPPHPNLITYIGYSLTCESEFIIMEFVDGEDLHTYITSKRELLASDGIFLTPHITRLFPEALRLLNQDAYPASEDGNIYTDPDAEYDSYNLCFQPDGSAFEKGWQRTENVQNHYINETELKRVSKLKQDIECVKLSKDLWSICLQIALGMEHLFSLNIVHGDLAARNILIQQDKGSTTTVKIFDFGSAHKFLEGERQFLSGEAYTANMRWTAPEVIKTKEISYKSDVWAYGITMWEVVSFGDTPFSALPDECVGEEILKGERPPRPSCCDECIYNMISECWHVHPEERPTFTTLVQWWTNLTSKSVNSFVVDADDVDQHPIYCEIDSMGAIDSETVL